MIWTILDMERPVPSLDLFGYIQENDGSLQEEEEAGVILKQLVEAARELESKNSSGHQVGKHLD